jgi:hypothetical protein
MPPPSRARMRLGRLTAGELVLSDAGISDRGGQGSRGVSGQALTAAEPVVRGR